MASCWIERRFGKQGVRFRVEYRVGGRDSASRYAGPFATKREALVRKAWVAGELAAVQVPDLRLLAPETAAETISTACDQSHASRVDVSESTRVLTSSRSGAPCPFSDPVRSTRSPLQT